MRNTLLLALMAVLCVLDSPGRAAAQKPLIIDHTCTRIERIPEWAILQAKTSLRIAYAHTSHGSQITTGMSGLVEFANGGGRGLSLKEDVFAWNDGGTNGALDLHDYAMPGDVGSYPDWVNHTRAYLDDPGNADVNVIMWSWCGQHPSKYAHNQLFPEYLNPMSQLEAEYPHVHFIYMTGHLEHGSSTYGNAGTKASNQIIRDYCEANNKILYDFADIESHDPDGTYYPFANDTCDYYASHTGPLLGNWAKEWQDSHAVGVDWYVCSSSHSESLNANQKAYAAWWLFARLAGWRGEPCQSNGVDLNCDGLVNMADLALLGAHWLEDS